VDRVRWAVGYVDPPKITAELIERSREDCDLIAQYREEFSETRVDKLISHVAAIESSIKEIERRLKVDLAGVR
jgi:hypothetical protein